MMVEQSRLRSVLGASTAAVSALRLGRGTGPRSTARRQRRRLAREIAAYRTPAERLELDLILSRHTAEQVQEIEEILRHQDAHRAFAERARVNPGSGV